MSGSKGGDTPSCDLYHLHAVINILELLVDICAIRADVQEPSFHKKNQTRVLVFKIVKVEMSQIVSHTSAFYVEYIHLSAQFPHYQV